MDAINILEGVNWRKNTNISLKTKNTRMTAFIKEMLKNQMIGQYDIDKYRVNANRISQNIKSEHDYIIKKLEKRIPKMDIFSSHHLKIMVIGKLFHIFQIYVKISNVQKGHMDALSELKSSYFLICT